MSQKSAKEFFKLVESDNKLQEKVNSASSSSSVIQIAADEGYEFSELDMQAVMQEAIKADEEISENALEAVAGGFVDIVIEDGTKKVNIDTDD